MVKTYSLKKDGAKKLSPNFKVSEFACKDGSDKVIIDSELVVILQKIRDYFDVPVNINSAYRTSVYNAKIGGVSNSQHTKGTAADIVAQGIKPLEVAQYVEHLMPKSGGIGVYKDFVHIDTRANRSRWQNYGKEKVVSGFSGHIPKRQKIETANDIIWELMNNKKYNVEIAGIDKAIKALNEAKNHDLFNPLYWILYKVVNNNEK